MNVALIVNLIIFILLLAFLLKLSHTSWSLSRRVLIGLVIGLAFGSALQAIYGFATPVITQTVDWVNVVGNGYVLILQMIVMPLIFASILAAVSKLHSTSSLGAISSITIGVLLFTTLISGLVGVVMVNLFHLSAEGLVAGAAESARLSALQTNYVAQVADLSVPELLLSFIPKNPFADLTGARPTSVISVVIFAAFLGAAAIALSRDNAKKGNAILSAIDSFQLWIMKLVRIVINLTPYGVLALMTKVAASSNINDIFKLITFIVASYMAMGVIFVLHGLLVGLSGLNPFRFFQKIFSVLVFAFTSRSSAASIPLNIEAQRERIGVPNAIASFSASFGATIGQNGCAGIYPAMLAAMVAPTVGINPFDPMWVATLLVIVTLSSIGVAGVGGGATFAALIVLPVMGLPITIVALLISIEPLIDMGRTALNVSGSMTAGTVTSQIMRQTDRKIFNKAD